MANETSAHAAAGNAFGNLSVGTLYPTAAVIAQGIACVVFSTFGDVQRKNRVSTEKNQDKKRTTSNFSLEFRPGFSVFV